MAKPVIVYFDYCCPFCYVGKLKLDRLERELGLILDWRYYQIHPEYPDEGIPLAAALGPDREPFAWESVQYQIDELKIGPLQKPSKISNTIKAQIATEYARTQGLFRRFHTAVYETYFLEGRGIGTADEVLAIGEKVGLRSDALTQALSHPEYLRKIREDDEEARREGVFGIPTLIVGGRMSTGALPYEDLKYFVNRWSK